MDAGIAQAEGIGDREINIRQHTGLQAVQVSLVGNGLGRVRADRHDLYTAPVKLGAQFLQPT